MDSPSFIQKVIGALSSLLPLSPLQPFIASIDNAGWLGYVNYFVPVGTFVSIGMAWLIAIAVFYMYQVVLRWAKVVGS